MGTLTDRSASACPSPSSVASLEERFAALADGRVAFEQRFAALTDGPVAFETRFAFDRRLPAVVRRESAVGDGSAGEQPALGARSNRRQR
jgi:hypothetical protein